MGNCFKTTLLFFPSKSRRYLSRTGEFSNCIDPHLTQSLNNNTHNELKSKIHLLKEDNTAKINDVGHCCDNDSHNLLLTCNDQLIIQPSHHDNNLAFGNRINDKKVMFKNVDSAFHSPQGCTERHNFLLRNTNLSSQKKESFINEKQVNNCFNASLFSNRVEPSIHFVALFDYSARTDEETSFCKRDEVLLLSAT